MDIANAKIAVIGLGYVGLPLAVEFGKKRTVVGLDINEKRIIELHTGHDSTLEVSDKELRCAAGLAFSSEVSSIADCNVYIVTVPTPIDENNAPDLTPLRKSSEMLGSVIQQGDVVIYESTVYPGATEEICIPIIEKGSGLRFNVDFYAGYSPERINPGDKINTLTKIKKITSGSTPEVAKFIDELYLSIITAGTHSASSIKVAEAAKVIENTQRDLNIALINELSMIFRRLGIDTHEVLEAAETKWNFMPFRPGLVGGHCIGVDPYYLTHKAQSVGYVPDVILAGRRINRGMGAFVAKDLMMAMLKKRIHVDGSRVLILGVTFKENCPDIRNTRVLDISSELNELGVSIDFYDPWISQGCFGDFCGKNILSSLEVGCYDAVVLAVGHTEFKDMGASKIRSFCKQNHIFYDVKGVFPKNESDLRL